MKDIKLKKERRLKKELRLLGYDTRRLASELNVSEQTVNNWCSSRTIIHARMIQQLLDLGVTKKAIEKPYELV